VHRAFTFRLDPTVKQSRALEQCMALQCELYNAALEERRMSYEWQKRRLSSARVPDKFHQFRTLTGLADLRPELKAFGVTVCRGSLTRLDEAFAGFFRRVNIGGAPGYPRFKSRSRFDSLSWCDISGWKLDETSRRLYIQGVGHVKINLHRCVRGVPKTLTVRRRASHLEATLFCAHVPTKELGVTVKAVGIDLGVGFLTATSDGTLYENPRHRRDLAPSLASAKQERSRHRRGSYRAQKANEQVARLKQLEANRRKDALHKLSRKLVDENDLIAHEKLKIANMSRSAKGTIESPGNNVAAKSGLNDAILDSGWGQLIAMITYKAEEAGRTVVAVDPRYTSQRCSACGHVAAESRKKQKFRCVSCGFTEHADVNAARNILRAGLAQGGNGARPANAEPVNR
jgi:putative transposase